MKNNQHVKIFFNLEQIDDWPPCAMESMWAIHLDDDLYQLDNTPFYITGVSYKDIIVATQNKEGLLFFRSLFKESGHSTIRIYLSNKINTSLLEEGIFDLCCSFEKYNDQFFAIDVPPESDIKKVITFLTQIWIIIM